MHLTFGAIVIISGQVVTLVAAILGYMAQRRATERVDTKVNGQLGRQLQHNMDLTEKLVERGIPVPPAPQVPPEMK
jgi:hypothetical protein